MADSQAVAMCIADLLNEDNKNVCSHLYKTYHNAQVGQYSENLRRTVQRVGKVAAAGGQLVIPCSFAAHKSTGGRSALLAVADTGRVHILTVGDNPRLHACDLDPRVAFSVSNETGKRWSYLVERVKSDINNRIYVHVVLFLALGYILEGNDFVERAKNLERAGLPGLPPSRLYPASQDMVKALEQEVNV